MRLIDLFRRTVRVIRMKYLLRRVTRLRDRQLKLWERFAKIEEDEK